MSAAYWIIVLSVTLAHPESLLFLWIVFGLVTLAGVIVTSAEAYRVDAHLNFDR